MREKRRDAVGVLRTLIAALDNAEAPPHDLNESGYSERRFGDPDVEIARRDLDPAAVDGILREELQARLSASRQLEALGRDEAARVLLEEARWIEPYLQGPADAGPSGHDDEMADGRREG